MTTKEQAPATPSTSPTGRIEESAAEQAAAYFDRTVKAAHEIADNVAHILAHLKTTKSSQQNKSEQQTEQD